MTKNIVEKRERIASNPIARLKFADLKRLIIKRLIRQIAKNNGRRNRKICSLGKGVKIGVLFEAENPANRQLLERFRENLTAEGALVSVLGYFPTKEFPEKLVFKPGFDYFKKKETDWKGVAEASVLNKVNALNLDICIGAFTSENLIFLHFIAQSNAGFRIGPYLEGYVDCFDFMIDTGQEASLENYLKLCTHYLKQLHP